MNNEIIRIKKIENRGLKHFIAAKSNVTNAKTFWFYDEKTGEYYEICFYDEKTGEYYEIGA